MNATMQLKKLTKESGEQDAALKEINRKLDSVLEELSKLKTQSGPSTIREDIKKKSFTKRSERLYIPEVDIENMSVKAGVKNIDSNKDIAGNVDKLNKLGG